MTIIYPDTSRKHKHAVQRRPAVNILRSMSRLLDKRRELELGRQEFLRRWRGLRAELASTAEYRKFRSAVRERDAGICQTCGGVGTVVHHIRSVAFAPQHALDPRNGQLVCIECHEEEHPWMRAA